MSWNFSICLSKEVDEELWEKIRLNFSSVADIDELMEYSNLARVVSDPDSLEMARRALENPEMMKQANESLSSKTVRRKRNL